MSRWLIVEDDGSFSESLASAFFERGYDVGVVSLGKDAIASMDARFDGAILDYNLPDSDGIAVLRALRKKFPDKIFGLITGETDLSLEKRALRYGADFFMRKPVRFAEIIDNIEFSRAVVRKQSLTVCIAQFFRKFFAAVSPKNRGSSKKMTTQKRGVKWQRTIHAQLPYWQV